jgi:hypothetical protein
MADEHRMFIAGGRSSIGRLTELETFVVHLG